MKHSRNEPQPPLGRQDTPRPSDVGQTARGAVGIEGVKPASTDPTFSPDGSEIAFISDVGGGAFDTIWVVTLEGGALRRLAIRGNSRDPVWSPDGSKIAFSAAADIWVAQPAFIDGFLNLQRLPTSSVCPYGEASHRTVN